MSIAVKKDLLKKEIERNNGVLRLTPCWVTRTLLPPGMVEGYGTINEVKVETPSIIRYNDITSDEMFVTRKVSREGVTITNLSDYSNIVMLKHFGPDSKEAQKFVR